jgi:hypothetical protein
MPILPVQGLARTEAFYEMHFGRESVPVPASCYLDTPDAGRLWKQLRSNDLPGLGPVADFDYGMREFVITDPDGNRLRVGSPLPYVSRD